MRRIFISLLGLFLLAGSLAQTSTRAQTPQQPAPLTNDEFRNLILQLPQRPALKEEVINEIRRRGIAFPLTSGIRSLVATKSGNDAALRRTLEEAERRRLNPEVAALPSEAEAQKVLSESRTATLAAAEAMPDFVVRQAVVRSVARGLSKNWSVRDRLTLAVSYRATEGERFRVLAVNGLPHNAAASGDSGSYEQLGGSTSTGDYVGRLKSLFLEESKTEFKAVGTDTLRARRAVVYEFETKRENSKAMITYNKEESVTVGARGRLWVDRETFRVLRMETEATEIEPGFPVTATTGAIDYEWIDISGRQYLLPTRAVVEMTALVPPGQTVQTRNDIRFRNYQKFGTEIKIIEEDIFDEEEPQKESKPKP